MDKVAKFNNKWKAFEKNDETMKNVVFKVKCIFSLNLSVDWRENY